MVQAAEGSLACNAIMWIMEVTASLNVFINQKKKYAYM